MTPCILYFAYASFVSSVVHCSPNDATSVYVPFIIIDFIWSARAVTWRESSQFLILTHCERTVKAMGFSLCSAIARIDSHSLRAYPFRSKDELAPFREREYVALINVFSKIHS